jgi:hypothetical protein
MYVGQKFSESFLGKARWVLKFGVTTYLMEPGKKPKAICVCFDVDAKGDESNWVKNKSFISTSVSSEK